MCAVMQVRETCFVRRFRESIVIVIEERMYGIMFLTNLESSLSMFARNPDNLYVP